MDPPSPTKSQGTPKGTAEREGTKKTPEITRTGGGGREIQKGEAERTSPGLGSPHDFREKSERRRGGDKGSGVWRDAESKTRNEPEDRQEIGEEGPKRGGGRGKSGRSSLKRGKKRTQRGV